MVYDYTVCTANHVSNNPYHACVKLHFFWNKIKFEQSQIFLWFKGEVPSLPFWEL